MEEDTEEGAEEGDGDGLELSSDGGEEGSGFDWEGRAPSQVAINSNLPNPHS